MQCTKICCAWCCWIAFITTDTTITILAVSRLRDQIPPPQGKHGGIMAY